MKLLAAFASRDVTIEGGLIRKMASLFPADQRDHAVKEMQQAIADARKDWWGPMLDKRFGPEEAEKMRKRMQEISIDP